MSRRTAAVLLLLLGGSGLAAHAQEPIPTYVPLDSLPVLADLARRGFEVAGVERRAGRLYAVVFATVLQQQLLTADGLEAEAAPVTLPTAPVAFPDLATVESRLASLAAETRVLVDTIGTSWEGRPILVVKIGTRPDAPDRPNVLFLGMHHAREWISVAVAMRLVEYLANAAAEAALLEGRDVWVIPVVNPDGYEYSTAVSRFWRKNRRLNDDGSVGVDLNRNYPAFWGADDLGSSAEGTAETFRGSAPASEPETQAVMAFHAAHPPDVAVSYHSYSNLVLYPYSHRSGALPADLERFRDAAGTPLTPAISDGLAGTARPAYHPGPGWQLYPTNGDYTEWAYREHGTAAFTVELTAGCCDGGASYGFVFPDDSAAVATVFADNLPFALDAIALAGTPPVPDPDWESLWPEVRLVTAPGAAPQVSANGGALALQADTLDRGPDRWRWRGPLPAVGVGTRVEWPGGATALEIVAAAGADDAAGWTGWARDSVGSLEGRWHWRSASASAGAGDTLRSPAISLAGIAVPTVTLWVRHDGSLFVPEWSALVEASPDGGASWLPLARLEGAAPAWYPVTARLPDAPSVVLRMHAHGMTVRADAIHVFGRVTAPQVTVADGTLGLSENPVRSGRVFFTWAPAGGDARISVFTFAGLPVFRTTVAAADGRFGWDLTGNDGTPVANGVYAVAVEVGGDVLRRRLFVVRGP